MAKVAFILADVFEDSEFQEPYDQVRGAGHEAVVVGVESGQKVTGKKGSTVVTDKDVGGVTAAEFDALVIPGGYSPDKLRADPRMVQLTREIHDAGKPVAAICHAGWMLVEADLIRGKTVTSYHSIKTDMINAGAEWVDRELVETGNLIMSRKPADLPAFSAALLKRLRTR